MPVEKTEGLFEGWVILEIMGHRKLAGYVTETTLAGASFLRLDVVTVEGKVQATQLYNPSSIYCLTPVTQEIAIAYGVNHQPAPVARWELPSLTSAQRSEEAKSNNWYVEEIDEVEQQLAKDLTVD